MILEKCLTKMFESLTALRLLKLKEMNPILKALLKFCTTKNLFKNLLLN